MGVNLSDLTEPKSMEMEDLRGKKVAIDTYNIVYQFMSAIRQPDGYPLCDSKGRTTSHLTGLLHRTASLIEAGIEPVFVFDGKPHPLKQATLDGRKERREKAEQEWKDAVERGDMKTAHTKAQQTSRMTDEVKESAKELIRYMGLPIVDAPSDGEQEAAYICRRNDVWATASQDFDSLLFGTPVLLRNLTMTGRRKIPGKDIYREIKTEVIDSEEFLRNLGISREQLVDMCILMGTDFNTGIKGIGPKKALKLVRDNGDLESVLRKIGEDIPDYQEIRGIFLDYEGSDDYSVEHGPLDRQAVVDMLTSYDFSADRVNSALDRIESARKEEERKRKQKALDAWF
ncbi:flap structure-specific endonuclease FEN-1 [Candidatus Methanomethylophilus alvi Mx1201]|uniref:Flap endonuclease 1 n=2 Tax=Methanomethylophilus alvi TaxID=1291540 RepID=M9SI07_METAX|nr:flap endonuclease-1 [Methanomethylophilus alvi]AGI85207.1 flap structure-specific endonuclease FEN-1 [Candidatus Methanomethylophilus alvi Mx1201]AYQ54637.1 flap endonuclease-1 [Methanomethylophilus alvi]